ncbi:MAG: hypothetical protein PHT50_01410 [Candidatus Omnitrophica bacterium]|nr:hypothetical protein [Candidatus Omnitrophota bacterium]
MPIIILAVLAGFLISVYLFQNSTFLERLGLTLFFAITAVPFININLALLMGIYINPAVVISSASCLLFLILLVSARKFNINNLKKILFPPMLKDELLALVFFIAILVFLFFYYSNIELLLSLSSYLTKGEASCFYMQSFRTISLLNPGSSRLDPLVKVYQIICTPGNILFTSTFLPILKIGCFRIIYLVFNALLLIFSYLICRRLVKNRLVSLAVSAFSVLNPYVLSVEVLDRNFMALSISVILFYVLLEHKEKRFLQGIIFGILAGTGLRFLPLLFIVPVFILWGKDNDLKRTALFSFAFFITFLFNVPHLFINGLNSLGENTSSSRLLYIAFAEWARTPFLPFPNLIFYLVNIVNYFGLLISGIICFGAYCAYKENKRLFVSLSAIFLLVVLLLAYQRNWLEGDKYRIMISGFLPVYIFLAFGLKTISNLFAYRKNIFVLIIALALPVIFLFCISAVHFNRDNGFYQRKYLYQKETDEYYELAKNFLLHAGFFPDYARLFQKLDIKRKRVEEGIVAANLFSPSVLPNVQRLNKFYSQWERDFFNKESKIIIPSTGKPEDYVYVKINFDKLAKSMDAAVTRIGSVDMVSLDLSSKEQLADVFYAQFDTKWQENVLPICIILKNKAIGNFKELTIDLNAFISLGKDDLGCDVVNSMNFSLDPALRQEGYKTGMQTFPLYAEGKSLIFKIPQDMKIIIKNWFINQENGVPFKVDSWLIKRGSRGEFKTTFFYNEPESYL